MPTVPTLDPNAVSTGPGYLWVAPVGTAEPASASATLDPAFRAVGYTEEGSTFTYSLDTEGIEVAEEMLPITTAVTGQTATVAFSMAQATRNNLILALNGGAAGVNNAAYYEPPALGSESRVMLVLDTLQNSRWIFRKCFQTGSLEINFHKAPDKKLLPVEFTLEVVSGQQPLRVFPGPGGVL